MKKQVKPDFSYIFYDKATVVWGHGNNIGGLPIIERIRLTICKITYVNFDKQTINWKMINMQNIAEGMKPPAGKWSINGFLAMFKSGEIFIKEVLK